MKTTSTTEAMTTSPRIVKVKRKPRQYRPLHIQHPEAGQMILEAPRRGFIRWFFNR
jgi:hypothetical protein